MIKPATRPKQKTHTLIRCPGGLQLEALHGAGPRCSSNHFAGKRCWRLATFFAPAKRFADRQPKASQPAWPMSSVHRRPLPESINEELSPRVSRPARSGRPVRCTGRGGSPPRSRRTPTGKDPRCTSVHASKSKAPPRGVRGQTTIKYLLEGNALCQAWARAHRRRRVAPRTYGRKVS